MAKLLGHTIGLKSSQLKRLNNLYRRRLPPDELILPEQARDLTRLSAELGRPLGLVLSRRGEVAQVVVGSPQGLPSPDPGRLRRGPSRLAGYAWLHTTLGAGGLTQADLSELSLKRWDLVASLEVMEDGLPGLIQVAHLLPQPEAGAEHRRLEPSPLPLAMPPRTSPAWCEAWRRSWPARPRPGRWARRGRPLLISVTSGPVAEAEEHLDELAELARSAGLSVVGRVVQRRRQPRPPHPHRPG